MAADRLKHLERFSIQYITLVFPKPGLIFFRRRPICLERLVFRLALSFDCFCVDL